MPIINSRKRYSWKKILPALEVGQTFIIPFTCSVDEATIIKNKYVNSISYYNKGGRVYYVNIAFRRKEIVVTRDE